MTPEPMPPEPDGPDDERFVYVVTAAGVEALRRSTQGGPELSRALDAALRDKTTQELT
jgi:hypothetical protein